MNLNSKNVVILTTSYFDKFGEDYYLGGLERYVHELCGYLSSNNCSVTVVQKSARAFDIKTNKNIRVVGIPVDKSGFGDYHFNIKSYPFLKGLNADLYIYASFQLSFPFMLKPSIGICHGIWWDVIGRSFMKQKTLFAFVKRAFEKLDYIIFNDTNAVNWFKANWPNVDMSNKYLYLPNFVDDHFFNHNDFDTNHNKIRILYPRRVEKVRGIYAFLEAVIPLMDRYDIHASVVGIGTELENVKRVIEESGRKTNFDLYNLHFDDMHKAYKESDIVVIPSLGSEGTSLSCLEAMAARRCVVSTNIGGLPNLIIDGYNGLLSNPNPRALQDAIEQAVKDSELRNFLAKNAVNVASVHRLENWHQKLGQYLEGI